MIRSVLFGSSPVNSAIDRSKRSGKKQSGAVGKRCGRVDLRRMRKAPAVVLVLQKWIAEKVPRTGEPTALKAVGVLPARVGVGLLGQHE
jgi:hypothetical protein